MGRRENPIDVRSGALARFASELRGLRAGAGGPSYRHMASRAFYSPSTLSQAASATVVPSLEVTLAFVRACDGNEAHWARRWELLQREIGEEKNPARQTPVGRLTSLQQTA